MSISLAMGVELDAWASDLDLEPRRQAPDKDQPGYDDKLMGMRMEPDFIFRQRILAKFKSMVRGRH